MGFTQALCICVMVVKFGVLVEVLTVGEEDVFDAFACIWDPVLLLGCLVQPNMRGYMPSLIAT